jgi:hypothetical protein
MANINNYQSSFPTNDLAQREQATMIEKLTHVFTDATFIDIRTIAHDAITQVSGPSHKLPRQKSQHKH